eukprot:COSAG02_NODE_48746_length_331_cov_1.327586_1_plen_75_part_10
MLSQRLQWTCPCVRNQPNAKNQQTKVDLKVEKTPENQQHPPHSRWAAKRSELATVADRVSETRPKNQQKPKGTTI